MRVGITGSTGLIGTALRTHLDATGHTSVAIVRSKSGATSTDIGSTDIGWDPTTGAIDSTELGNLDAIVHLAGAGIGDRRWTESYRQVLMNSRVDGTTLLANTLAGFNGDGPHVLISASAIGYYGNRGDETVDEASTGGEGFLAEICRAWEAGTEAAESAGVRVAHIRTGIVLSRHGGALKKMLPLFKLGAGGRFGNGRQWMSWISIDDQVRAIEHLLTSSVKGAVNLTAPSPVRNAEFAKTLARALRRPSWLPVPAFAPKLLLGSELANALLFDGQRVQSTVLHNDGFEFAHSELDQALDAILDR